MGIESRNFDPEDNICVALNQVRETSELAKQHSSVLPERDEYNRFDVPSFLSFVYLA